MPNILKRFSRAKVQDYVLPEAEELEVPEEEPQAPETAETLEEGPGAPPEEAEKETQPEKEEKNPIAFAKIQAEAIVDDARRQAAELLEKVRQQAEEEAEEKQKDGYTAGLREGYAEGLRKAEVEAQGHREELAQQMQQQVQQFLEEAAGAREAMLDATAEEMRDLALATAEKIIHVSLKSSSDVVMRMVLHATEKLKRREWVNVYIAGCDLKGTAQLPPSLTTALAAVSDHVKIIPIADDESGTCIIEMPDEIIDASAGTQLSNIRDQLAEIPLR